MTATATVLAVADYYTVAAAGYNTVAAADTGTSLEDFGTEPWWLILIKVLAVFVALTVTVILTIWAERRIVARMQQRSGPNRTGPFGSAQGLADGIKLALKEDIIPALADKPVYILAPIVSAIPAFVAFAVIPFGPTVSIFGERTPLQLTDLPIGVLFVLAMSALGVYGIVLAGWASGSTYPLLGGLRSAAQLISYEIPLGLSLVPVFLFAGSLSTSEIVDAQADRWFVLILAPSFIIFVIAMVGETNRAPFDLPEAESELVGGFHTEYSSLKFAMFFLAEYINMVTVSAVATTLFLGGWRPPPIPFLSGLDTGFFPLVWFAAKVFGFLFFFIWLRGTLPRMRYDQFMKLGWKVLVPFSLIWILLVAAVQVISDRVATRDLLVYGGVVLTVLLLVAAFYPGGKPESGEPAEATAEPSAGGFPLPLLPGDPGAPTLPAPATQRSLRSRAAVPSAAPDSEREVTRA